MLHFWSTAWLDGMSHRKRRETKQQLILWPDLALLGCCIVSLHFQCDIPSSHAIYSLCESLLMTRRCREVPSSHALLNIYFFLTEQETDHIPSFFDICIINILRDNSDMYVPQNKGYGSSSPTKPWEVGIYIMILRFWRTQDFQE